MDAAIMTAAEHAFAFRHQLLRRAVGEMIPAAYPQGIAPPVRPDPADPGESADRAAGHLLQAAQSGHPAPLAGRWTWPQAQTLPSVPQTAANRRYAPGS